MSKDMRKMIDKVKKFNQFLNENVQNTEDLIQEIKKSLIMETLVDEDEFNEL
jgi:hypothetical protein